MIEDTCQTKSRDGKARQMKNREGIVGEHRAEEVSVHGEAISSKEYQRN